MAIILATNMSFITRSKVLRCCFPVPLPSPFLFTLPLCLPPLSTRSSQRGVFCLSSSSFHLNTASTIAKVVPVFCVKIKSTFEILQNLRNGIQHLHITAYLNITFILILQFFHTFKVLAQIIHDIQNKKYHTKMLPFRLYKNFIPYIIERLKYNCYIAHLEYNCWKKTKAGMISSIWVGIAL